MLFFFYLTQVAIIKIMLSYAIINKNLFKSKKNIFLFICIILCASFIAYHLNTIYLFFLLIMLLLLTIKNNKKSNYFSVIMASVIPFVVELFTTYLTSPLINLLDLPIRNPKQIMLLFLIDFLGYTLIVLISILIAKRIIPLIERYQKEQITFYFLFFFVLSYLSYQIYQYYSPDEVGFILIIQMILSALLIYFIIRFLAKNKKLEIEVERQKIEKDYMLRYSEEMKQQYDQVRKFKHDYLNILASLDYYISTMDIDNLEDYFRKNIQPTRDQFNQIDANFEHLQRIQSEEIRSILAIKLMFAKDKNIQIELEVPDIFPDKLAVNSIVIVRILGIILDNSIEEVTSLKNGTIQVGLLNLDDHYLIVIKNSIRENIEPLHILNQEGFSSKGENRGLGLTNLNDLTQKEKHLILETTITSSYFIQKIAIFKGDD